METIGFYADIDEDNLGKEFEMGFGLFLPVNIRISREAKHCRQASPQLMQHSPRYKGRQSDSVLLCYLVPLWRSSLITSCLCCWSWQRRCRLQRTAFVVLMLSCFPPTQDMAAEQPVEELLNLGRWGSPMTSSVHFGCQTGHQIVSASPIPQDMAAELLDEELLEPARVPSAQTDLHPLQRAVADQFCGQS